MKKFIFKTTATMKPHNNRKWWIDGTIVGEIRLTAENLREALEKYRETVAERYYIDISRNAIKNKSEMFVDGADGEAVQVGYVITGQCDFEDRDNYKWSKQYIDLWVTILTVVNTDFSEV